MGMGGKWMGAGVVALSLLVGGAASAAGLKLSSPDLKAGETVKDEQVLNTFGCTGQNISPALSWSGAPAGTKSFALTVYDPDAPTGSGWWHWVVFNIPPGVTSLSRGIGNPASGQTPKGAVQSRTDFGKPGYGGPCPPQGDKPHRYIFTVYALKVDKIDADENASAALVGFMINANRLDKASFTATYGRK